MAMSRTVILCSLIWLTIFQHTVAEIHRAKINAKHAVKKEFSYVSNNEKNDQSNVASSLKMDRDMEGSLDMFMIKYDTWLYSIVAAMLVGLSGVFPLLVIPIEAGPSLKHGAPAAKLKLLLSFAVGGLLGDVFLHLLPEAWDYLHRASEKENVHAGHTTLGLWVITGMMSFLIIEKMFAKDDEFEHLEDECSEADAEILACDMCKQLPINNTNNIVANSSTDHNQQNGKTGKTRHRNNKITNGKVTKYTGDNEKTMIQNDKCSACKESPEKKEDIAASKKKASGDSIKVSGYLNLFANVIDNFTHGLAVAGGFLISKKVGFITTTAILLHEVPHEIGDFAILLRSGFNRWQAAKVQLLTASGGIIGAVTALTADSAQSAGESTSWILPFTSGGFIYIALVTVVPDLLEERHPKESTKQIVCLLAGIGSMYCVSLIH